MKNPDKPLENPANSSQFSSALRSSEKQGPKPGNGAKIAAGIFAVLAIFGIGFGVYEFLQNNNKATENAELKSKNSSQTEIDSGPAEKQEWDAAGNCVESAGAVDPVNTAEYIYVGEWGIKIHIGDKFKNVNFLYRKWDDSHGTLYISGRPLNDPTASVDSTDDFTDLTTHGVGIVAVSFYRGDATDCSHSEGSSSCFKTIRNSTGEEIGIRASTENGFKASSEEQRKLEVEAMKALIELLGDYSNYSAI